MEIAGIIIGIITIVAILAVPRIFRGEFRRAPGGMICKECKQGRYEFHSSGVWNPGSERYRFVERFYLCSHCGRTVSSEWPEQW